MKLRNMLRTVSLCALATSIAVAPIQSQRIAIAQNAPAPTTFDSVTLDIALLWKRQGDERFIAGATDDARDAYCEAMAELENNPILKDPDQRNVLSLLKADLQYRMSLLNNGYSFWGATQSLKPSYPGLHVQRLQDLLSEFTRLNEFVQTRFAEATKANMEAAGLKDFVMQRKLELAKAASSEDKLTMEENFLQTKQGRLDQQIADLRTQRQILENQLGAAMAQAKAASSQLERLVADAALSSAGIPPSVYESIKSKKWDAAIITIATQELGSSETFQAALKDYSRDAAEIAARLREAEQLYKSGKQTLDDVKAAGALLRDPSFESLTQLGTMITDKMSETDRKNWRTLVASAKPAMALVELIDATNDADLGAQLRLVAEGYIAEKGNQLRETLRREASKHFEELLDRTSGSAVEQQAKLIASASKLLDSANAATTEKAKLLDVILQSWPEAFLSQMDGNAVLVLIKAAGVGDRNQLVEKLKAKGIDVLASRLSVTGDAIKITKPDGSLIATVPLKTLFELPSKADAELSYSEARTHLLEAVSQLTDSKALRSAVLENLPTDRLEATIQGALQPTDGASAADRATAKANADELWAKFRTSLGGQFDKAIDGATAAHVGSVFAQANAATKSVAAEEDAASYPAIAENPAAPGELPKSSNGGVSEGVAVALLTSAYPGVGLAAKAFTSFNNFNDAIDRAQRLSAQLQRTLSDELQTIDAVGDIRLKREITQNEIAVSKLAQQTASDQLTNLATAISANSEHFKTIEARVVARRALALYINERMREEFDLLDRSIASWTGKGSIASRVVSDPRLVRLQLDSDIHLYNWLDRSIENSRSDLDGLEAHWARLVRLAKDDCQAFGCDGGGTLGKIKESAFLPLENLISTADLARLRHWQASRSATSLVLTLDLDPIRAGIEPAVDERSLSRSDAPALENLRVIDVRVGMRVGPGRFARLSHVSLEHPGYGYVRNGGVLARDTTLPMEVKSLAEPAPFDLGALRKRFLGPTASIDTFDGYAFQTRWGFTLEAAEENWSPMGGIFFRFALQYSSEDPVTLERGLAGIADMPQVTAGLPADVMRYVARWNNSATRTVVNAAGSPQEVRLSPSNQIDVPIGTVALAAVPAAKLHACPGSKDSKEAVAAAAPAENDDQTKLRLVRVCSSDADIRRMLQREAQAQAEPRQPAVVARLAAEKEFKSLKDGVCRETAFNQHSEASL
ncbi:hypothetical protein [Rhizobium ruizarguesonis]|uniref:hypothetical protein n=1 Tax=Rhizobium ruizarguesonis TaxID=2081791 RepID=UPI001030983F|nr:hypothetical protein [Rhizobium ruizarguesonis]TBF31538.1 hypothetical protein ELG93_14940 [Rhizobium ruizarguesonis]